MRLQINDQWRIESDERCWNVQRYAGTYKSGKHVGKPKWVSVSYHGTLPGAINSLAQRLLRESDASTNTEALDAAWRISEEINDALAEIGDQFCLLKVKAVRGGAGEVPTGHD